MTRTAELHRIACPYCAVGHAEILIERPGGGVEVRDFDEPRRCSTCKQFFRLRYRVQIIGVGIDSHIENGKVAT